MFFSKFKSMSKIAGLVGRPGIVLICINSFYKLEIVSVIKLEI